MNLKDFFQSKQFKRIYLTFGILAILTLVFSFGVFIGSEKARFSYRWSDNYYHNFVEQPSFPNQGTPIKPHGLLGEIIKQSGNQFILRGADNIEITILNDNKTVVVGKSGNLKISDLKEGEKVVVIGGPDNQGRVRAKLIRVDACFLK
jgi:hypothetical protein